MNLESEEEINEFRRKIIKWGKENFRSFPWRETKDPYKILVSEIMLHRTRAEQVVSVYETFLKRYPNVYSLSRANYCELEEILAPLGLRWRILNLKKAAKFIVENYAGKIPDRKDLLLRLPGVSGYIAGAVLCFAYGKPEPLLDTNTVRILGRVFDIEIKDSSRRSKKFQQLMEHIIDKKNPRIFNYALLDLGALICVKKHEPQCRKCPVRDHCRYYFKKVTIK